MNTSLYEFKASPQPVNNNRKPLYRNLEQNDNNNGSLFKGSTWSSQRTNDQDQQPYPFNNKLRKRAKRPGARPWRQLAQDESISEVLQQARRIPVDISSNLVEQVEATQTACSQTQTAAFVQRPETPPYVPKKRGVDRGTDIQTELFDFDTEVEPILNVIISKTLEQSLKEVEHEEELALLQKNKAYYLSENVRLQQQQRERELIEMERWKAKEQLKKREAERLRREIAVCEKTAACKTYERIIGNHIRERVFDHLCETEHFRDERRDAIMLNFLPWVYEKVGAGTATKNVSEKLVHELIKAALGKQSQIALDYRRAILERRQEEERKAHEEVLRKQKQKEEEEERKRKEEEERNAIRIYLRGEEVLFQDMVGPIKLSLLDTICQAEEKIQKWVIENIEHGEDIVRPEGGYLRMALDLQLDDEDDDSFDPDDNERTLEFLDFMDDCVVEATPPTSDNEEEAEVNDE